MYWPMPVRSRCLQRAQNADRRVHPGHDVGDDDSDLHRPATGCSVRIPGHAHDAAHGLQQRVVARPVAVRSRLAKAGDRAIDNRRIDLLEALVVQPVTAERSDLEVLDDDIRDRRELTDDVLAARLRQVERDGFLVPVRAEVKGGFGGVLALLVVQERRSEASGVVAVARTFHLDDFRSHIRECLRRPRTREDSAQVENPYACEWTFRHLVSLRRRWSGSRAYENGCHGRPAGSPRAGM